MPGAIGRGSLVMRGGTRRDRAFTALRRLSALVWLGTLACASTQTADVPRTLIASNDIVAVDAPARAVSLAAGGSGQCPGRAPSGGLRRASLQKTLDRGLGSWLRGVDIEPFVIGGKFGGWRLRALFPGDPCYRDVDLKVGDIITRVNGRSIEKPEQAHEVWQALRRAEALVVDYRREGVVRRLEIPIVEP